MSEEVLRTIYLLIRVCIPLWILYLGLKAAVYRLLFSEKPKRKKIVKAGLGAALQLLLGIICGSLIIILALLPAIGGAYLVDIPGRADTASNLPLPTLNPLEFLSFIALQSLNEELAFRGVGVLLLSLILGLLIQAVVPKKILRTGGMKLALLLNSVFISSLVFAFFHSANPNVNSLALLNIFLAGVFFGLAFINFRSILLTWGIHFSWNYTLELLNLPISGFNFATTWHPLSLSAKTQGILTGGSFGPEGSIVLSIILLLGCFCAGRLSVGKYLKAYSEKAELTG